MFIYDDIQWTGKAVAGINIGNGVNHVTVHGSQTLSMLDAEKTSNIGVPGVWIFRVDRGNIHTYVYVHANICTYISLDPVFTYTRRERFVLYNLC